MLTWTPRKTASCVQKLDDDELMIMFTYFVLSVSFPVHMSWQTSKSGNNYAYARRSGFCVAFSIQYEATPLSLSMS